MKHGFTLYLLPLLSLFVGCIRPELLTSSKDPGIAGHRFRKVAILADSTDVAWRQVMETHVDSWADDYDLSTVPDIMLLSPFRAWTEDERRAALMAQGVDALLVLHPERAGIDSFYVPPKTISTTTTDVKSSGKNVKKSSSASQTTKDSTSDTTASGSRSTERTRETGTQVRTSGASETIVTRSEEYTTEGYMSRSPWVDLTMKMIEFRTGQTVWMAAGRLYDNPDSRRHLAERLVATLEHDRIIGER